MNCHRTVVWPLVCVPDAARHEVTHRRAGTMLQRARGFWAPALQRIADALRSVRGTKPPYRVGTGLAPR